MTFMALSNDQKNQSQPIAKKKEALLQEEKIFHY